MQKAVKSESPAQGGSTALIAEAYNERKEVIHLKMVKRLQIFFLAIALLSAGCATTWTSITDPQEIRLKWPNPPEKTRIEYLTSLKGFREEGTSLKNLVYGKEEGKLMRPVAVAAARDGRIAIADTSCRCVHFYIPSSQKYSQLSKVDSEDMVSPVGVAFDDESRLYVSDSALAKVFVFDSQGVYLFAIETAGERRLKRPTGIAFNSDNKILYVIDTLSHKVDAFDKNGLLLFSFGDRANGNGQFNFPTHIFWSLPGRIYVTDAMNFRIQIFDSSGRFLTAFGHQGDGSGDFAVPKGVAADKDSVIYVVDSLFDNVQLFNENGGFLLTLGSRGNMPGEFWLPSGIFIDAHDKLYVCDSFNKRIQIFRILREPAP